MEEERGKGGVPNCAEITLEKVHLLCEKTGEWAIEQGLQAFSIKNTDPRRHYFWKERKGKEKETL